jgi:hypothetical protein
VTPRFPLLDHGRLRKRWTYVGVFSPALSLCAAAVQVGPARQEFWAVAVGDRMWERTRRRPGRVDVSVDHLSVRDRGTWIDLALSPAAPIEVRTPYAPSFAWTRKRAGGRAQGTVVVDGESFDVDGLALVDESAGYPPRRTSWLWSAGAGLSTSGEPVAWNTTVGLHDVPPRTESTVWVNGVAREITPGRIAADLSSVAWDDAGLSFSPSVVRRRSENLLVVRSSYEQPFGAFTGTLPGGVVLASAQGVMERHDAVW